MERERKSQWDVQPLNLTTLPPDKLKVMELVYEDSRFLDIVEV